MQNQLLLGDNYFSDKSFVACHNDGSPLSPGSYSKVFSNILKRVTINNIWFHDLRHTAATNMLRNGTDIKTVSEILGHASTAITYETYAHVLDAMKRDAVEKMTTVIYNPDPDEKDKPGQTEEVVQDYIPMYQVVSGGFN